MDKYNIDKSFGIGTKFKIRLNKSVAFIARRILKNSYKCLKHSKDIVIQKERIDVCDGSINVFIIKPINYLKNGSSLFYIHGGGFAFDIQPHQFKNAAQYAVETGSIVVLPQYRLTPKATKSIIFNDCFESWKWVIANAKKLEIDKEKIAIGGDSAGGYLAARLTNMLIKSGENVFYQLLIYPVIDSKMRSESMKKYIDTPMWNAKNNKIMWEWFYKGENWEESLLDESISQNLPPTYIETTEFDCLHDEGLLYGEKIKKLGVEVVINETHKTMHGFDIFKSEITSKALIARKEFINKQIENGKNNNVNN